MVDSAFDANSWVTSRKVVLSYPTALNARLKVTSQQSILPSNRMAGSRMKGVKMLTEDLTKNAKLAGKLEKKAQDHLSSLTKTTDTLTVQVITGPMIVQQDSNHRHPC